jgi:peptidoglycan/LPS O-acetylase OafA/YrhL
MALAALLVANSHLESFYPHPWLAGDGLLGNSIFFFLAGFGLTSSDQTASRTTVGWWWRRIVRLYPAVILATVGLGLLGEGEWRTVKLRDYITTVIWPTRFTFVQMVMPLYAILFVLVRLKRFSAYPIAIAMAALIYTAAYMADVSLTLHQPMHLSDRPLLIHATSYLAAMLLGACIAWRRPLSAVASTLSAIMTVVVFNAYVAAKYFMVTGRGVQYYPALHLMTLILCVGLFDLLTAEPVLAWLRKNNSVWRATKFVAALTLEIYVVHVYVVDDAAVAAIPFPLNLGIFWALTLPTAWAVGKAAAWARRSLLRNDSSAARRRVAGGTSSLLPNLDINAK